MYTNLSPDSRKPPAPIDPSGKEDNILLKPLLMVTHKQYQNGSTFRLHKYKTIVTDCGVASYCLLREVVGPEQKPSAGDTFLRRFRAPFCIVLHANEFYFYSQSEIVVPYYMQCI